MASFAVLLLLVCSVFGWAQPTAPLDSPVILIDGSSTVAPIIQAAAALFAERVPDARLSVGISGTSGGFRRWLAGETDINDASRPIKSSEIETAKKNGIEYIELMIGIDGLVVAVSVNTQIFKPGVPPVMTLGELELLWSREAEGFITRWSQLGSRFTDAKIVLSGAASTSGTFDFFTEVVCGKAGDSRADYFGTEEDQLLAELTGADPYALTYFGLAYLEHNLDRVQAVAIDPRRVVIDTPPQVLEEINRRRAEAGKPPLVAVGGEPQGIYPTFDTVSSFLYQPLSRPLFVYVNVQSLRRPLVRAFLEFLLSDEVAGSPEFMLDVGYVPVHPQILEAARRILQNVITGTAFGGKISGLTPEELFNLYLAHAGWQ